VLLAVDRELGALTKHRVLHLANLPAYQEPTSGDTSPESTAGPNLYLIAHAVYRIYTAMNIARTRRHAMLSWVGRASSRGGVIPSPHIAPGEKSGTRMRICLVSREFPPETHVGGIGTYTHKTSAALARMGHEVHVVTSARKPATDYMDDGVLVHRMHEPADRGYMPPTLAHALAVAAAIDRIPGRLDIVQACEWSGEALWYAIRPSRQAPLVTRLATPLFVVRRLNESKPSRSLRRGLLLGAMERVQTLRSDGIISPTRALAEIVCGGWNIAPARVTVVPTGADPELAASQSAAPLPEALRGREYLLYFGRLERRKGVHILGAALPAVLDAHPSLHAVFVGDDMTLDGRPMQDIIRACAGVHADRLIFLPRVPQPDLIPIIRGARLVVLPSLWENLANTCLEAMQLGRPVVATWGCGFEEVIEDGVSGFLARPGDAEALALRMLAALNDVVTLQRVAKAAERRASEFSLEAMVERLVEYYRRVIERWQLARRVGVAGESDAGWAKGQVS
jgi:glycogen(starch) synthase